MAQVLQAEERVAGPAAGRDLDVSSHKTSGGRATVQVHTVAGRDGPGGPVRERVNSEPSKRPHAWCTDR